MISITPLALQRMTRANQTLCLLHLLELRNTGQNPSTAQVREIGLRLSLPASANLSADLGRLVLKNWVIRKGNEWAITPLGHDYLATEFLAPSGGVLVEETNNASGAEIQGVRHSPVPPELAPTKALEGVRTLLERSPWNRNVMLVTRLPRPQSDDPIPGATETIRVACQAHGLTLLVASEQRADDRLGLNVVSHMWASMYAIGLFEDRVGEGLNANVAFEVGALVMTGRRVLVVRDRTSPPIPSDLTDHIYSRVDLDNQPDLEAMVHQWFRDDLRLGSCRACAVSESSAA